MSTLKQRFLLISDMHYTTEETAAQLKLTHPKAIASAAAGNAFGKTQREKIETIYTDILQEHCKHSLPKIQRRMHGSSALPLLCHPRQSRQLF